MTRSALGFVSSWKSSSTRQTCEPSRDSELTSATTKTSPGSSLRSRWNISSASLETPHSAQRGRDVSDEASEVIFVVVQRQPRDLPALLQQVLAPRTGEAGLAVPRRSGDQDQLALARFAQPLEKPRALNQLRTQPRRREFGLDQVHREAATPMSA